MPRDVLGKTRPLSIGRRLVRRYLRGCGGVANGFTYTDREEALAVDIANELTAARKGAEERADHAEDLLDEVIAEETGVLEDLEDDDAA